MNVARPACQSHMMAVCIHTLVKSQCTINTFFFFFKKPFLNYIRLHTIYKTHGYSSQLMSIMRINADVDDETKGENTRVQSVNNRIGQRTKEEIQLIKACNLFYAVASAAP
jgi:hypothetical protein